MEWMAFLSSVSLMSLTMYPLAPVAKLWSISRMLKNARARWQSRARGGVPIVGSDGQRGPGGPATGSVGPGGAIAAASCHRDPEIAQPDQVVERRREDEQPAHSGDAAVARLAKQGDRLQPAKDFLDPFAPPLTEPVAGMPRGPAIDGTAPPARVLRDVGGEAAGSHLRHEGARIGAAIGPQGGAGGHAVDHGQCGLPFRGARGGGDASLHHQPLAVVHPRMAEVAELGFVLVALGISRASGSVVEACVALLRRSPWKFTVGLPGSSGGVRGSPGFLKLFNPAQASIRVPSTVKCSSPSSRCARAWASTCSKNAWAMSPSSSRCRFLANTVASQMGSSMFNPTNQRNNRL